MGFRLFSDALKHGEAIPDLYSNTRLGRNLSPPLKWKTLGRDSELRHHS